MLPIAVADPPESGGPSVESLMGGPYLPADPMERQLSLDKVELEYVEGLVHESGDTKPLEPYETRLLVHNLAEGMMAWANKELSEDKPWTLTLSQQEWWYLRDRIDSGRMVGNRHVGRDVKIKLYRLIWKEGDGEAKHRRLEEWKDGNCTCQGTSEGTGGSAGIQSGGGNEAGRVVPEPD